jgi:hypothetical protein
VGHASDRSIPPGQRVPQAGRQDSGGRHCRSKEARAPGLGRRVGHHGGASGASRPVAKMAPRRSGCGRAGAQPTIARAPSKVAPSCGPVSRNVTRPGPVRVCFAASPASGQWGDPRPLPSVTRGRE